MRLDRYLCASLAVGTKQAHGYIQTGCVRVNGAVVLHPNWQVFVGEESVSVNHQPLAPPFCRLLVLHKPKGFVSTAPSKKNTTRRKKGKGKGEKNEDEEEGEEEDEDEEDAPSILGLVPAHLRHDALGIYGRLDKDTTGLILLGTDGGLGQLLHSPQHRVEKEYVATLRNPDQVHDNAEQVFREGVVLVDGHKCLPATLRREGDTATVVVAEGRFHLVKRMVRAVGGFVGALHRRRIGALVLDPCLKPGEVREANEQERAQILATLPENRLLAAFALSGSAGEAQGNAEPPKAEAHALEAIPLELVRQAVRDGIEMQGEGEGADLAALKQEAVRRVCQAVADVADVADVERWGGEDEVEKAVRKLVGKEMGRAIAATRRRALVE